LHTKRDSIAEKIRSIKQQQDSLAQEEQFVHDVNNFKFAQKTARLDNLHGNVYSYSQRQDLRENGLIYKQNTDVY